MLLRGAKVLEMAHSQWLKEDRFIFYSKADYMIRIRLFK
jgi:hypothetical protein